MFGRCRGQVSFVRRQTAGKEADLIEIQSIYRLIRNQQMTIVNGIKSATEESNGLRWIHWGYLEGNKWVHLIERGSVAMIRR